MKCPKCSFVSHDYLDACRKCSIDLVDFKTQMHLVAVQPGVIDLSMVFETRHRTTTRAPYATRMQDDFLGSQMLVESEESDDTFDISLDDDFGMSPTQIEQLRAIRPGGDDENAETPDAAITFPNFQEPQDLHDSQGDDRISFDATPPATSVPPAPPKSGYATVMIDLDDMEEMLDKPRDGGAEPGAVATGGTPETPDSPDLELSSLDAEEFTLTTAEAEEPTVMETLEATAGLSAADEMTLQAEADEMTLQAEADEMTLQAEADEMTLEAEADEMTLEAEADEMTLEAEAVEAVEALEAPANLDEADEMTIIDEMVGFTSAEATEATLDLNDLEAEDSLELADLTDMSLEALEAQDIEEMDAYQATELETALEMPSIDLEAALTAEEPMEMALDDDPGEEACPLQTPFASMDRDEAEDDLRLEFDDLDLDDDERSSS